MGSLVAFGNGVAWPSFSSLYSKACEAEQAGELLGQSQSMVTTGRIAGPIAGGAVMQQLAPGAPFVFAAVLMLIALLLFRAGHRTLIGTT